MRPRTKFYEVVFFSLTTRDFRTEIIERTSLQAAKEYGKERERNSDELRFRWVEPASVEKHN